MDLTGAVKALELRFKRQAQDDFLLLPIRRDQFKTEKLVEPARPELLAERCLHSDVSHRETRMDCVRMRSS